MDLDFLSAAYVRGYAERTGIQLLPEPLRQKALGNLTSEELAAIHAIGKESGLKMGRFKNYEDLPRVQRCLVFCGASGRKICSMWAADAAYFCFLFYARSNQASGFR